MKIFREVDLQGADAQIDTSTLVFSIMTPVTVEKEIEWCRTCDTEALLADSGIDWWTPGCQGAGDDVIRVALVKEST